MKRQESVENYLESIYVLGQYRDRVRAIDIVHHLGFTKPSVSIAMKNLRNKGFIATDNDGNISLTPIGDQIAKKVYERHTILTKALILLGVPENVAKEDACKIEHDLSEISFEKIQHYVTLASQNSKVLSSE